jgi:hypothetical protein
VRQPASDIVEAQWVAERRGLERFHTEQPPYSILNRAIEREVLPVTQRYGMGTLVWGTLVWGPLAQGLLTGRVRKGEHNDLRRAGLFRHLNDERRLDAVEALIPLAQGAGLPLTHLAMSFAIAHPGVTSALLGPRTTEQLDDLLAGMDVTLSDEILDRVDEIVPPGTDVGTLDQAYLPQPSSAQTFAADPSSNAPPCDGMLDRTRPHPMTSPPGLLQGHDNASLWSFARAKMGLRSVVMDSQFRDRQAPKRSRSGFLVALVTVFTLSFGSVSAVAPEAFAAPLACRASMSNAKPKQYSTTSVLVSTVARAGVTTTAKYKTTNTERRSVANVSGKATVPYLISSATPGFTVVVSVVVTSGGKKASCSTKFVPEARK